MPARLNPDASSSRKMLELYSLLLFSGKQYSLTRLAERLQCSKTTIERLISEIEMFDHVEFGKEGRERWFQITRLRNNKHVQMMYENVQQLAFCKDMVSHMLPEDFKEELQHTVDKAASMLSDKSLQDLALEPIARSLAKGMIDYTPFQSMITLIMQAIPKKRLCDVVYKGLNSNSAKSFFVAPMRLLSYHNSLYIECWRIKKDEDSEIVQPMILAVHRIEAFNPTKHKHKFDGPPDNADGYFGLISNAIIDVVVRFDKSVARYVVEREWSKNQSLEVMPDGDVILKFTAKSQEELFSWLLSFGCNAELVEPIELRAKLRNLLNSALALYCERE